MSWPARGLFRSHDLARALGLYLPTTGLTRLIGLVRNVLLTWWMPPAQFGLLMLTLQVSNVLMPVCGLSAHGGLTRFVPAYETRGRLASYLRRVLPVVLLLPACVGGVIVLLAPWVGGPLLGTVGEAGSAAAVPGETAVVLARWAGVATLLLALYFSTRSLLRGLRMFAALCVLEIIHILGFTALAVVVVLIGWSTAGPVMATYAASLILAIGLLAGPLWRVIQQAADQRGAIEQATPLAELYRFSVWAAGGMLLWHFTRVYPLWYLNRTLGPTEAAVLAAVWQITQLAAVVILAIITVAMPLITKTWESQGRAAADRQWRLAFKTTSLFLLLVALMVALLRRPIMSMFHPRYAAGAELIPLCLLLFLLAGNLRFLVLHFRLILKTRCIFLSWSLGVAGSVVLARWLIAPTGSGQVGWGLPAVEAHLAWLLNLWPSTGLAAAAWTGVLSFFLAMVACLVFMRLEGRRLDRGSVLLVWAPFCLCLRSEALVGVLLLLAVLAGLTSLVFSPADKRELWAFARRLRAGQITSPVDAELGP